MQTVVEVFKTTVPSKKEATTIIEHLQSQLRGARINFDLDDSDHILRIEHNQVPVPYVHAYLEQLGYACERLE